ncbi:hypothetical protein IWX49DRAFT_328268 [Phyllosticta citricarpa]|uniref:Uncharacterized protein n=2 Tax=Phyllosticta TaxID=121621 RepID=A0ABR1M7A8_9PEZI
MNRKLDEMTRRLSSRSFSASKHAILTTLRRLPLLQGTRGETYLHLDLHHHNATSTHWQQHRTKHLAFTERRSSTLSQPASQTPRAQHISTTATPTPQHRQYTHTTPASCLIATRTTTTTSPNSIQHSPLRHRPPRSPQRILSPPAGPGSLILPSRAPYEYSPWPSRRSARQITDCTAWSAGRACNGRFGSGAGKKLSRKGRGDGTRNSSSSSSSSAYGPRRGAKGGRTGGWGEIKEGW